MSHEESLLKSVIKQIVYICENNKIQICLMATIDSKKSYLMGHYVNADIHLPEKLKQLALKLQAEQPVFYHMTKFQLEEAEMEESEPTLLEEIARTAARAASEGKTDLAEILLDLASGKPAIALKVSLMPPKQPGDNFSQS